MNDFPVCNILLFLGACEIILIESFKEKFSKKGIKLRKIAETTLAIDSIPSFLQEEDVLDFLNSFLEGVKKDESAYNLKRMAQNVLVSVKTKKKKYTSIMAKEILERLKECEDPYLYLYLFEFV